MSNNITFHGNLILYGNYVIIVIYVTALQYNTFCTCRMFSFCVLCALYCQAHLLLQPQGIPYLYIHFLLLCIQRGIFLTVIITHVMGTRTASSTAILLDSCRAPRGITDVLVLAAGGPSITAVPRHHAKALLQELEDTGEA